jgi:hypothetical protein
MQERLGDCSGVQWGKNGVQKGKRGATSSREQNRTKQKGGVTKIVGAMA